MKLCAECGQPIEANLHSRIDFKNRSFHPECFTCALCQRRLNPSQTFTLHNDQPWCRQCELDTKNCCVCGQAIVSAGITYETREYHVECFKCSHCHKSLDNEKLLCANKLKPYCVACNDELFAKRCNKCKQPIPHDTRYTTFDDNHTMNIVFCVLNVVVRLVRRNFSKINVDLSVQIVEIRKLNW